MIQMVGYESEKDQVFSDFKYVLFYYIIISSIITIIQQFLFFIIVAYFKFDKVTDFVGATNFFVISIITLSLGASFNTRQLLISFGCLFMEYSFNRISFNAYSQN